MTRVLFVCIGNACRSQMAEAFARAYGSDVLIPESAGLAPAYAIPPDTVRAMDEKGLDVRGQSPKSVNGINRNVFDLVINMSGFDIPEDVGTETREWDVPDPVCLRYEEHREVRDAIERMVMNLILELRRAKG